MEAEAVEQYQFSTVGGNLSLDFTNTVGSRLAEEVGEDHFSGYADLVRWGRQMDIVSATTAQALLAEAARRPIDAATVFAQAQALRETLYRVFSAVIAERAPEAADMAALNAALAAALPHLALIHTGDGFAWDWCEPAATMEQMLWPIARAAADLLTSEALARVEICAADTCGWLFVDTSRNHSRRWCDMNDCGNRAKARRHYQRRRVTT
jgi:predicted RNA-binding Zn ribbon-like protein